MLSEPLLKKFDEVIGRYPLKRSAIVPLLLFAQDEIGYITDEAIREIARRVEVRPIEVIEDIGYYSMLHRQPIGKYNFQVCTNISCMLRGGEEIFALQETARNRPPGKYARRSFRARRSRMPGRMYRRSGDAIKLRLL